jgi:uncharacterized protein (UPF0332 family)
VKDSTRLLLDKSQRAIHAATILQREDSPEFAAGRAYYAMFYAAEALLNEKSLQFSKHSGVHGAFGEHFVKTGLFETKYHRWLLDAFDRRLAGDYAFQVSFTPDEVQQMIDQAEVFWNAVYVYLEALES